MGFWSNTSRVLKHKASNGFARLSYMIDNTQWSRFNKSMPDLIIPPPKAGYLDSQPIFPYPTDILSVRLMKFNSVHLTTILNNLLVEIFREDIYVEPNFAAICTQCEEEFDEMEESCTSCGGELREPDKKEMNYAKDWLKMCNRSDPLKDTSLTDVLKFFEGDLDTYDDAWIIVVKDYTVDANSKILDWTPIDVLTGPVEKLRLVQDALGRAAGYDKHMSKGFWTCVLHRKNNLHNVDGLCKECDRPLVPVIAIALDDEENPVLGYIKDEVKHMSKYNPSERYGYSPVVTAWILENTIFNMDLLANVTYREQRAPKGALVFNTRNENSLKVALEKELHRVEQNPNHLMALALDSDSKSGGVQFIPFTPNNDELQTVDMKKEMINRIAAMFGVQPIFMGDTSTSGGLNNEGLQITVALKSIQWGHSLFHNDLFIWLQKQLKLKEHRYRFQNPVEQDKVAIQQRRMNNLNEMKMILDMNAEVHIEDQEDLTYRIEGELSKPEVEQFGGFGEGFEDVEGENNYPSEMTLSKARGTNEESKFKQDLMMAYKDIFKGIGKEFPYISTNKERHKDIARSIVKKIRSKMEDTSYSNYSDALLRGFVKAGVDPSLSEIDTMTLRGIAEKSPLSNAFQGIEDSLVGKFNKIITEAFAVPGEFSHDLMVDRMKKEADVETYRLDNIARTETTKAVNIGRELGYNERDPEGDFKYDLTGKFGKNTNTCEAHEWIKSQIDAEGGAVNMKRFKELHKTAKERWYPTFKGEGMTIHWRQRKTFRRVV